MAEPVKDRFVQVGPDGEPILGLQLLEPEPVDGVGPNLMIRHLARQFRHYPVGVIDFGQRLAQRTAIDRHGTIDRAVIAEIAAQRLDVAVEDQADDFAVFC